MGKRIYKLRKQVGNKPWLSAFPVNSKGTLLNSSEKSEPEITKARNLSKDSSTKRRYTD